MEAARSLIRVEQENRDLRPDVTPAARPRVGQVDCRCRRVVPELVVVACEERGDTGRKRSEAAIRLIRCPRRLVVRGEFECQLFGRVAPQQEVRDWGVQVDLVAHHDREVRLARGWQSRVGSTERPRTVTKLAVTRRNEHVQWQRRRRKGVGQRLDPALGKGLAVGNERQLVPGCGQKAADLDALEGRWLRGVSREDRLPPGADRLLRGAPNDRKRSGWLPGRPHHTDPPVGRAYLPWKQQRIHSGEGGAIDVRYVRNCSSAARRRPSICSRYSNSSARTALSTRASSSVPSVRSSRSIGTPPPAHAPPEAVAATPAATCCGGAGGPGGDNPMSWQTRGTAEQSLR